MTQLIVKSPSASHGKPMIQAALDHEIKQAKPNGITLAQLMREASKKNLFSHIENPAEWQREIRKERPLPGRLPSSRSKTERKGF